MNDFELYAWFKEKRERLATILTQSSTVIKDLNMTNFSDNLRLMGEKVNSDTFKIQVIGTFKNGKSTFINSLLGEEVLPAFATPCTAVINEVKYGEEKGAVLHFRNPLPDFLIPFDDSEACKRVSSMDAKSREGVKAEHENMRQRVLARIPRKAHSHMLQHHLTNIPPLPIAYNEIEDYVVIPIDCDMEQALQESPYDHVELFYPLDLLKNGVEIIDSPGLNEAESRTKVTMDYLSKADAIIMLMDATKICSQDEMRFIEQILVPAGFNEPFFVVNRWDAIRERERAGFDRYARLLSKYTTQKIHFVSSLNGLDAKIEKDDNKYEQSGVKELERVLMNFLTKEKGRVKLAQPAQELNHILNDEALFKIIPTQRAMLETSLNELEERYEKAKPQLEALRLKKEQILSDMRLRIERSRFEFKRAADQNALSIIDKIPAWVQEYHPKTQIGAIPSKSKLTTYSEEVIAYVQSCMEEEMTTWRTEVLEPLVKDRAESILDNMKYELDDLYKSIDEVHYSITGQGVPEGKEIPVWERVAGAIGGMLIGGAGAAYSGSISGLSKELAQTIAFNIGGAMLLGLLGIANPVTLIMLLVGTGIFGHFMQAGKTEKNVKESLITQISDQLANTRAESSDTLANGIIEKMNDLVSQVGTAVDIEIANVEEQIQSTVKEMKEGQERIDSRMTVIDNCEQRLQQMTGDLSKLTFELMADKNLH